MTPGAPTYHLEDPAGSRSCDLAIRFAMGITALILVGHGIYYGAWALMWWLAGALPFGLLTGVAFWVAHVLRDPHRGGLACTLLIAALAWPTDVLFVPAFLAVAFIVVAAPRGRLRPYLLLPAATGLLVAAGLYEPFVSTTAARWWDHPLAIFHCVVLAAATTLFAFDPMPSTKSR